MCGPNLVMIGQKLRPVSQCTQTDRQTDEIAIGDCVLAKILIVIDIVMSNDVFC